MADNKEIKVGTQVLVYGSSMTWERIETIDGETKTCWKIGGNYYKKDTLAERGSDAWNRTLIRIPNDKDIARIVRRNSVYKTYNFFNVMSNIEKMSEDDLSTVITIISKYKQS